MFKFKRVTFFIFKLYLLTGIVTVIVVAGANSISLHYLPNARSVATVPPAFKPIEFVLDRLF